MSKFSIAFAIQSLIKSGDLFVELNDAAKRVKNSTQLISHTVIDSRACIEGSMFVAFTGEDVDGHDYIYAAKDLGANLVIVERFVDVDIAQIKVKNCQLALAQVAKEYRCELLQCEVVAITGSAGKTSTKDILAFLLSKVAVTQSTQGNLNNELGLPLTLLNTDTETRYLVVEMGAAERGDISYLMHIATPNVGVITNIGDAHIGRFGSAVAIAEAKTEMFAALPESATAVLNADDAFYGLFQERAKQVNTISFSLNNSAADIYRTTIENSNSSLIHSIVDEAVEVKIPFAAPHQIMNFMAAVSCVKALNITLDAVAFISEFKDVAEHRQIVIPLSSGIDIIDDSYNSNPAAMKVAIDYAVSLGQSTRRLILIFGAMGELGEFSEKKHIEIAQYAIKAGIKDFIFCGDASLPAFKYCQNNNMAAHFFSTAEQAGIQAIKDIQAGDLVLVKGSRAIQLEAAVEMIVANKNNNTWGHSACC